MHRPPEGRGAQLHPRALRHRRRLRRRRRRRPVPPGHRPLPPGPRLLRRAEVLARRPGLPRRLPGRGRRLLRLPAPPGHPLPEGGRPGQLRRPPRPRHRAPGLPAQRLLLRAGHHRPPRPSLHRLRHPRRPRSHLPAQLRSAARHPARPPVRLRPPGLPRPRRARPARAGRRSQPAGAPHPGLRGRLRARPVRLLLLLAPPPDPLRWPGHLGVLRGLPHRALRHRVLPGRRPRPVATPSTCTR